MSNVSSKNLFNSVILSKLEVFGEYFVNKAKTKKQEKLFP